MFEKIRDMICKQLNKSPDKITKDTKIVQDLGADSLDIVEMLMALEDEFNITVPDEVAANLVTIGDIAKYVEQNIKK